MSTRIRFEAFKNLVNTNGGLYHALLEVSKAERGGEIVLVQDQNLRGEAFVQGFAEFVKKHPEAVVATEQPPDDELWAEQQAQANRDAAKARIAEGTVAAGKQYQVWLTQGLENTSANQALLADWITANTECPSAGAVDAAIRALGPGGTQQLTWKKAATEPAPALVELPPARILSDGKPELPLGTPVSTRYSVEQLRDLDRRTREEAKKAVRVHNNQVVTEYRTANQPTTLEVEA